MTNGYGTAVGGEYNYWDGTYSGGTIGTNVINGNTVLDGGSLTGGHGALTDGNIANKDWESGLDTVENFAGTGQYVGWTWGDPTITFNFAQAVKIASMTFYVDNPLDAHGGVAAPKSFTIGTAGNNTDYLVDTAHLATGPVPISFSDLGLDTQNVTVTINRNLFAGSFWVFLSEVTFDDGIPTPVPEPSSLLLFGAGLAAATLLWKRRTV